MRLGFLGKLKKVTRRYKAACIKKAWEKRREEFALRQQLLYATQELHSFPSSEELQNQVSRFKDELNRLEDFKLAGLHMRSKVKWKQFGDGCTREFFQAVQQKHTHLRLTALLDLRLGTLVHKQSLLERICFDFYSELYDKQQDSNTKAEAKREFLELLDHHPAPELVQALAAPVTISPSPLKHAE